MNWYKLVKLAQISGEYWIDSSGNAMNADTDTGDYSHESYVIEMVQDEYNETGLDWREFELRVGQQKAKSLIDEANDQSKKHQISSEWQENQESFAREGLKELGMTDASIEVARGNGDARLYGMTHYGMKRLQGYNVETWTLTNQDLRIIANGLWDAYDDRVENETFNIFVHSSGKWYNDIPWDDINSGNVMKIVQHLRTQFNGIMAGTGSSLLSLPSFPRKIKEAQEIDSNPRMLGDWLYFHWA